jgi:hypothetical protein
MGVFPSPFVDRIVPAIELIPGVSDGGGLSVLGGG